MAVNPYNDTTPHAAPPSSGKATKLSPGDTIGLNYVIQGLLARGGMAEIYTARDLGLGKIVAVKVLQAAHEKKDNIVRGLQREAHLLASMPDHDHLVKVFASAQDPARKMFFVVMELLEGKNLREYMQLRVARNSPFSVREAVTIAITIANTLYDLHVAKFFHRDLKPENVFIQKRQGNKPARLKLLDLGAALAPSAESYRTEDESRSVGTPLYMSPEQTLSGVVTERADIYALGMMLYELLRGAHAWADREIDPRQGVQAIAVLQLHAHPTPLTECVPGFPADLSAIVTKMIAKDPKDRFASAHEVAHELSMFLKRSKGALKEAQPASKDMFVEALIDAPSSPRSGPDPYSGIAHQPPSTVPNEARSGQAPPSGPPQATPFGPTVLAFAQPPAPAQPPRPGQFAPIPKTDVTPQGLLAQVGLAHLGPGGSGVPGSSPPGPRGPGGKNTMRIEIGRSGQAPIAVAGIEGVLRLDKLTSPDEPPEADGVQAGTLRELLPRLPPRDAVLQVDSLLVVEGPARLLGLRFPIEFVALKIGRAREANIVIPHVTVSRTHCGLFAITDGVFEVVDTNSSYGIEVNDISTQRSTLRARGRLRVGDVVLQLVRARTKPPEARESKVFNSVALDPSITAYNGDAIQQTGGLSRATVASSKDRHRFERAATGLPPVGTESISAFALGQSIALDGPGSRPVLDPTKKMEIGKFTPGPAAVLRGGPNPWRQSEAKLTHDYFEVDTFPPTLKAELTRGNKASLDHLTAEQPSLGAAGMTVRLADCLFMMNEHAARLELLSGAPGGKVYQDRLAGARDWDGMARSIIDRVAALKAREKQGRTLLVMVGLLLLVGAAVLVYMFVLRPR